VVPERPYEAREGVPLEDVQDASRMTWTPNSAHVGGLRLRSNASPPVYGLVVRVLLHWVLAVEVTQEVTIETWRAAGRFDTAHRLGPGVGRSPSRTAARSIRYERSRPIPTG